jgi:hypothetical protein
MTLPIKPIAIGVLKGRSDIVSFGIDQYTRCIDEVMGVSRPH